MSETTRASGLSMNEMHSEQYGDPGRSWCVRVYGNIVTLKARDVNAGTWLEATARTEPDGLAAFRRVLDEAYSLAEQAVARRDGMPPLEVGRR